MNQRVLRLTDLTSLPSKLESLLSRPRVAAQAATGTSRIHANAILRLNLPSCTHDPSSAEAAAATACETAAYLHHERAKLLQHKYIM